MPETKLLLFKLRQELLTRSIVRYY